ncbi:MAG TPA: hypothetical protein VK894_04285, partial [Jiangellales bacterium]|nr:hypothetical protein [Jiangellales bacterium]
MTTVLVRAVPSSPAMTSTAPTAISAMISSQSVYWEPVVTPVPAPAACISGSNVRAPRKMTYHQRLTPRRRPTAVSRPVWSA